MTMRGRFVRTVLLGAVLLASAAVVSARQFPAPPGWKWVTDAEARIVSTLDPPEGAWLFGTMAPGWHITTRPGAIVFEPTYSTRGRYAVESESFLFPGASPAGFGVFVGGADLESGGRRYVAFLIRRDGSAAVEAVDGGRTAPLHPWTKTDSVLAGKPDADVKNVIRVEAEAATVTFLVNDQKVAEVPRDARFDGIVGLRVGPDLNLHVTNLDLTHRLALPRRAKQP
jgi:hypothetical protein